MLTTSGRDTFLTSYDSHFVGWIGAITDWRAGTVTELSYTGYARAAITFGSAANTTPAGGRQRANSAAATGGQKTDAGTVDAIAWGIWTASTAGTLKWIGLLDSDPPVFGTVVDTTGDAIVSYAHGLVADQRVFVLGAPGAALPTGVSENTAYFVGTVADADHFTLSTTAANANPVAITAGGSGLFCPYTPLTIAQNATPEFAIGALVIQI